MPKAKKANQLVKAKPVPTGIQDLNLPEEIKQQYEMSRILAKSGLLPQELDTPAKVFLVLQQGRELGLQPMQAINGIYVVKNRTGLTANLMASLIRQSKNVDFEVTKWTEEECVMEFSRGKKKYHPVSYTMEDAKRAGLLSVNPRTGKMREGWAKYPKEMLKARCLAKGARLYCADIIQGMYTVDELEDITDEEPEPEIVLTASAKDMISNIEGKIKKTKTRAQLIDIGREVKDIPPTLVPVESKKGLQALIEAKKVKLTPNTNGEEKES